MKPYIVVIGVLMLGILASGCEDNYIMHNTNTLTTVNGTFYDPSRTFELTSFCSMASFSTNTNVNSLNCTLGDITDLSYSNVTGNWSCMSCVWDTKKCSTENTSDILNYAVLNLTAAHILSSNYNTGFTVMCCNSQGSQCYAPQLLSTNGTYAACGAGYNELIGSITFNNVSNNWSVTSCLNGFK